MFTQRELMILLVSALVLLGIMTDYVRTEQHQRAKRRKPTPDNN